MSRRWQVVALFHGGGVRVRCTHRSRVLAELCLSARSAWRSLADPTGRYVYDLRREPSRPTALLIPSPWSGDEYDPTPRTYPVWFWLYKTTRALRHKLGLHDWIGARCSWCGKPRTRDTRQPASGGEA